MPQNMHALIESAAATTNTTDTAIKNLFFIVPSLC